MPDRLSPLQALVAAFSISSFGGLAALLRSDKPITWRAAIAAVMYSGMMGLVIALLWYNFFDGKGNVFFLLGVSGLAGIGGTTAIDFLIQVIKKGGVQITITPQDTDSPQPPVEPPPKIDSVRIKPEPKEVQDERGNRGKDGTQDAGKDGS